MNNVKKVKYLKANLYELLPCPCLMSQEQSRKEKLMGLGPGNIESKHNYKTLTSKNRQQGEEGTANQPIKLNSQTFPRAIKK